MYNEEYMQWGQIERKNGVRGVNHRHSLNELMCAVDYTEYKY